jgi:cytoskeletal protein RodZ
LKINYDNERLKKARKEKNKTIEEVSRETAIGYWQIQSLEQKETKGLISETLLRSALKQYCKYLNIPYEDILLIDDLKPVEKLDATEEFTTPNTKDKKSTKSFYLMVISIAISAGIFLNIYFE